MDKITPSMEANRCAISSGDCNDAMKYLEANLELKRKESDTSEFTTHREGLLLAAIISYSRAFTKSQSEPYATPRFEVDLGKVFSHDPAMMKLHERILNLRHKAVAHSDWEQHNSELLEVRKDKSIIRGGSIVLYHEIDIDMFWSIAQIMCDYFRSEMVERDIQAAK